MLCQDCKKREAQVHLTQIVNNEKLSLSLCKDCAAARGFHSPLENSPFPLAEILSGLAGSMGETGKVDPADNLACPICGLTFIEFTRQGRFAPEVVDRQLQVIRQPLQLRQGWRVVAILIGAEDALGNAHGLGTFLRRAPGCLARVADQNAQFLGAQSDLRRSIHAGSRRLTGDKGVQADSISGPSACFLIIAENTSRPI